MPHDAAELSDLGVLRVRGPDAVRFLQGQLSNDLALLERAGSLLAGLHNPQGRTIALLRLLRLDNEDILALVPRELLAPVAARLARFVLRSKVQLADDTAAWRLRGLVQAAAPAGLAIKVAETPAAAGPARWISVTPAHGAGAVGGAGAMKGEENAEASRAAGAAGSTGAAQAAKTSEAAEAAAAERGARREWRLLDIAAGLPQVYASTSEQFVAQMLNLDAVGAISFSKGCYTGQEVIARAHYRGRVKRRMQRWRTAHPAQLAPGDAVRLADGRALRVVEAATLSDGRCELLAVAPLAPSDSRDPPDTSGTSGTCGTSGTSADADGGAGDAPGAQGGAQSITLEAESLPLPYELPA